MAKRGSSKSKRPRPTATAGRPEAPAAAEASEERSHLLLDYLDGRKVVIGLLILELAIVVALFPKYYYHSLVNGYEKAYEQKHYEKAYRKARTLASFFGQERLERGESPGFFDEYLGRRYSTRARYRLEAAKCLIELERYEEASKQLEESSGPYAENLQGLIAWRTGDREQAVRLFKKILGYRKLPGRLDTAHPNYCLGKYLYDSGAYLEATFYLKKAIGSERYRDESLALLRDIHHKILKFDLPEPRDVAEGAAGEAPSS